VKISLTNKGYDLKVTRKDFSLDSIQLLLKSPASSDFLADVDYSQHLLQISPSVPVLLTILSPLNEIFHEMNYGRPYNVLTTQLENTFPSFGGADAQGNSMNANDASSDVQLGEEELEEEERNTDDERVRGTDDDENLCIVCEESRRRVVLVPCNHMCLCTDCASEHLLKTLNECPMCRAKIEDSMKIFW
jgi:hypothetical protein